MPKIVLMGQEIPEYDALNVDSTLSYMAQIAEENENFNLTLASLTKLVYQDYQNEQNLKEARAIRLQQAREFFCIANGFDQHHASKITPEVIAIFIEGSEHDAVNATKLKNFINELQKMPSIELPLLATFYYTLKIEFDRMCNIQNQSEPEKLMIEKLMIALKPFVLMSEKSKFQRLYNFCESFFIIQENTDVNSDEVLKGHLGTVTLKEDACQHYFVALIKMIEQNKFISIEESEAFEKSLTNDNIFMSQDKPSCYNLTVDTYLHYPFKTLYLMANIYDKMKARKKEESFDTEWVKLQQEIEKNIEEARILSLSKKLIHSSTQKSVTEEQNLLQKETPKNKELWLQSLKALNKDHFTVLENLFSKNPNAHVTFSQYSKMITALGGKVITFDGSKTRILLSGQYFNLPTNKLKATGGFHKPHENSIPFHFIQKRLACNALESVGLTKKLIASALVNDSTEPKQSKVSIRKR